MKTQIKSRFGKIMHFIIHNNIMVTVAVICLVHLILLFMMLSIGVTPLFQFNILSVVVYFFCVLLCKSGHIYPVLVSIIVEVSIYTIVSTHYIGLRCGTYYFLFSIMPIVINLGCFIYKGTKRWRIVPALIMIFAVFVFLYIRYSNTPPVYPVSTATRTMIVLFSSSVMVFATIFYNAIYIFSSEVERVSLEKENRQLSLDATEDSLTNLLNRRGFLPMIERYMNNKSMDCFCIAFCDIDNFKRINDSYGHDCGDEVLRHITKIIKRELMGCDICRWGGEEIVIFMKDYDLVAAREKMEYVRRSVEMNPTIFFNKRINTTITIGLAESRESYKDSEDLIRIADERMYYGKQNGKNILICE